MTLEGERIAGLARKVVAEIDALERAATAMRAGTRRRLIVSATEFVIADILAPALPELQRLRPELLLDLRAQAAVVSLAGREADLAIRMSAPEGSSLFARKLGTIALGLYASESYLAGRDVAGLKLDEERLLGYDDSYGRLPELDALAAHGLIDRLAMTTNSTRALLTAALAGGGIALLPSVFARGAGLVESRRSSASGAHAVSRHASRSSRATGYQDGPSMDRQSVCSRPLLVTATLG